MPSGACICASPPPVSRIRSFSASRARPTARLRPPNGLLRQASRMTMLSLRAGAFHLAQHQIGVEHLEVDVRLLGRVGVDRNEIVLAADLHAMARIVEQPDIGARQLRPEGLHGSVEGGLVEIELRAAADQRETERTAACRPGAWHRWRDYPAARHCGRPNCRSPARRACRRARAPKRARRAAPTAKRATPIERISGRPFMPALRAWRGSHLA